MPVDANEVLDVGKDTLENGTLFEGSFKNFGGTCLLKESLEESRGRGLEERIGQGEVRD